jgi:hypothetical protein
MLEMGAPADEVGTVITGVSTRATGADWVWAYDRSAFDLTVDPDPGPWSLDAKITAAAVVLSKTGPQTVRFRVNGVAVGSVRAAQEGTQTYRFAVHPETLRRASDAYVEMSVEPCLVPPSGPPLGVLLHRIGFSRELR